MMNIPATLEEINACSAFASQRLSHRPSRQFTALLPKDSPTLRTTALSPAALSSLRSFMGSETQRLFEDGASDRAALLGIHYERYSLKNTEKQGKSDRITLQKYPST